MGVKGKSGGEDSSLVRVPNEGESGHWQERLLIV